MSKKCIKKAITLATTATMLLGNLYFAPESTILADAETTYTEVDDAALDAVLGGVTNAVTKSRNSVHDPSVITTQTDGVDTYYVFGSHMGVSKTTDLLNWTSVTGESETSTLFGTLDESGVVSAVSYNQAFRNNAYTGKVKILVDGVETEVDFGTYDASAWNTALDSFNVQGNMWAPDIIYNTTMNKWCMYLSLNGNQWNSSIILLTADNIEGPYVYQGPVIYSGFNGNNAGVIDPMDTDLELVYPGITELPAKYNVGKSWGTFWPHAIDPCVSYDEEGNLYLIYGSWSGGIYGIELDETNGLRDYTVTYDDVNAGQVTVTSDAYFGKKLAGGAYVSGEGAYVEKIGDYWYLFMSYGFYSPNGGYEMRIFRSEDISGPYVDSQGNSAIFSKYVMNYGVNGDTRGEKLMAGYQWDTMPKGEIAQGHNSVFTDANGNTYLVYHTKFNDGSVTHELRVHQLFVNEDGWLVAAPYEYSGQTVNNSNLATTTFTTDEITGDYQVIVHKYGTDYNNMEIITPSNITLHADGTVTGAYSGSWAVTSGSYVNVTLDGTTYKGVLVEQIVDGAAMKTLCFTAAAANGVNVWGSKVFGDELAIALTRDSLNLNNANKIFPINNIVYQNVTLPTTGLQDAVVTWSSNNTDVISDTGVVTVPETDTDVTLTCRITKGNTIYQKSFNLTVVGSANRTADTSAGRVSYFTFEEDFSDTLTDIVGAAEAQASGTIPSIKNDTTLNSKVVQLNFGYDGASTSNYVTFTNPLKGNTTGEATISLLVNRNDTDVWDAIWGFMDSDDTDGVSGRFYLTGNAYIGYNGTGGWFDANHSETVTNAIPVGKWSLVTVSATGTGFSIYINGALEYTESYTDAYGSGNFTGYANVPALIASADTFYLGYGSWWGTNPCMVDDLMFYNKALNNAEASALYDEFLLKLAGEGDDSDNDNTGDNNTGDDNTDDGSTRTYDTIETFKTYYNDFEDGLGDATVVGSGEIETVEDDRFGSVYHNATGTAGVRTNYLLLPSDTIANAVGNKEMSIGFWVNVADATNYWFSPIFTAYGDAPDASTGNSWPMMALQSRLLAQVNCAGWTDLSAAENVAGTNKETTAWLDDKEWHYYTATLTETSVCVYVDGVLQNEWAVSTADGNTINGIFTNGADLDYVCLGGNQAWTWGDTDASYQFDEIAVYSTALSAEEIQLVMNDGARSMATLDTYRTYYNDFEGGLGDATVVGSGAVEAVEDDRFDSVYHNATGTAGVRTNYLLLPSDTIANAVANKEMSIGFWVNVADATNYWFSPIFTAYGDAPDASTGNSWPMMALQSRLLAQVNCAGWTDLSAAENVAGTNKETTAWLDDKEWHYYTATLTETSVCVYVDGVLQNEWAVSTADGNTINGIFTNGADLDYVCLGGNQAWTWGDNDASYQFDQVAVYSTALTKYDIAQIMANANDIDAADDNDSDEGDISPSPSPEPTVTPEPEVARDLAEIETYKTYYNDFENGLEGASVVGNGAIETVDNEKFGKVYHNATANAGVRTNYLLLPSDTIANAIGNKEISIAFWINVADATNYYWTPLFTAHGDAPTSTGNTWPMMALQSRLVGSVNCAGWTDLTDSENVAGANTMSTLWLDDKEWHYYTATITETSVCIYVDGVLQNEWAVSTTDGNTVNGLFTNGTDLDYVALGGNQAFDWADNDSSYQFDGVAVYSTALSAEEIQLVMAMDPTVEATVEPTAEPTVEPTAKPTVEPTAAPTVAPTVKPTAAPTVKPTVAPTTEPVEDTEDEDETEEAVATAAPTEAPTATEAPAVTEEPVATEAPVATEEPVATEAPAATEEPATTAEPTSTEEPVATEVPVVTEAPSATAVPKDDIDIQEPEVPMIDSAETSENPILIWAIIGILAVVFIGLGITAGMLKKRNFEE